MSLASLCSVNSFQGSGHPVGISPSGERYRHPAETVYQNEEKKPQREAVYDEGHVAGMAQPAHHQHDRRPGGEEGKACAYHSVDSETRIAAAIETISGQEPGMAGFEVPEEGRMFFDGALAADAVRQIPPEKRGVGVVLQSYALWPHMDVAGNVAYPLKTRGEGRHATRRGASSRSRA